jgi:hypothetical protein
VDSAAAGRGAFTPLKLGWQLAGAITRKSGVQSQASAPPLGHAMCLNSRRRVIHRSIFLLSACAVFAAAFEVQAEVFASSRPGEVSSRDRVTTLGALDARNATDSATTAVAARNARLERAEPIGDSESATLTFDVYNEVDVSVTDIMVSVSVLGTVVPDSPDLRRVVVQPFKIRLKEVLLAGGSVHYELRLRNLSPDCDCVPTVEVIDARVLADTGLENSLPPG